MVKSHAGGRASDAPTPAQLKELFSQIDSGRVTKERFQTFLLGESISSTVSRQIQAWADFYRKFFRIELDMSSVKVPAKQLGIDRLIIIAKGLTLNQVYSVLAQYFPCWRYADDLGKAIPNNDRTPANGTYAFWVHDRVEADEELENLSADKLKEQGVLVITLLERMIYELKYFDETSQHLDVQNWTLCAGSRGSDGGVPRAGWYGRGFKVDWDDSSRHFDRLRARAVVPCPA